jgi:hypothetical protein
LQRASTRSALSTWSESMRKADETVTTTLDFGIVDQRTGSRPANSRHCVIRGLLQRAPRAPLPWRHHAGATRRRVFLTACMRCPTPLCLEAALSRSVTHSYSGVSANLPRTGMCTSLRSAGPEMACPVENRSNTSGDRAQVIAAGTNGGGAGTRRRSRQRQTRSGLLIFLRRFMNTLRPRELAYTLRAKASPCAGGESIFEPALLRSSRTGSANRRAATCR